MVRLFLENEEGELNGKYINVNFWSLTKAWFFGNLGVTLIILGILVSLGLIGLVISYFT